METNSGKTICQNVKESLKKGGLCSFLAHDYRFLTEHYPNCLDGHRFYPFADSKIYWEAFEVVDLAQFAELAGFDVIFCEKGNIYKPEDGTILHCLCRK